MTPKAGDRVRATLGESVVVGTVCSHYGHGEYAVEIDGADYRNVLSKSWTFEVLTPPVPDFEGTVALDKRGDVWVRGPQRWFMAGDTKAFSYADLLDRAPLTELVPKS